MSEVRITDPVTGGQKGQKPERYSLIPVHALEQVARVYNYGAKKYAPNNYLKGYDWSLSLDALKRHIAEFEKGQAVDEESELPHMAHAVFHCMALIMFEQFGLGTDDRWRAPKPLRIQTNGAPSSEVAKAIIEALEETLLSIGIDPAGAARDKAPDTEREGPPAPELRVGARVRVVEGYYKGEEAKVIENDGDPDWPWVVMFDDGDRNDYAREDLEVLS